MIGLTKNGSGQARWCRVKSARHLLLSAAAAVALIAIPEAVGAYRFGPGPRVEPSRHAYVYDPKYRLGSCYQTELHP
jgi:hypothetical protein